MVTAGLRSTRGVQRSTRATAKLAWLLCGLALALLAAALLVLLIGRPPATSATDPWQRQAADLLSLVGAPLLGGLIAARRPHNRYGWLWLTVGLAMAVGAVTAAYGAVALASGPAGLPGRAVATWLGGLAFTAFLSLFPFVFLLFPNGRLPSPRWRPWAWAIIVIGALTLITVAFVPGTAAEGVANPFGIGGWLGGVLEDVVDPGIGVLTLAIAVSGLSMLLRFRRALGVERQQLKWFAFAAALLAAFLISQTPPLGLQTFGLLDLLLETLTITGVYAGIGIAVLRYRLYEIDRLANRTLVYGTLTALLGLVYAAGVFGLGGLLNPTGGESALAVAASTLAVAALFRPARRRVQQVVDRRFNRRRYDAVKTIDAFAVRLRDQVDLDTLSAELLTVVEQTMEPTMAWLWLRPPLERSGRRPIADVRPDGRRSRPALPDASRPA